LLLVAKTAVPVIVDIFSEATAGVAYDGVRVVIVVVVVNILLIFVRADQFYSDEDTFVSIDGDGKLWFNGVRDKDIF
jgi:hypothetical protein